MADSLIQGHAAIDEILNRESVLFFFLLDAPSPADDCLFFISVTTGVDKIERNDVSTVARYF